MENKEMTPEMSFKIISDAIAKSRKDIEKNGGTPLIAWGIIVVVFSFIIWMLLRKTGNPEWNFLWFSIPIAGWPVSSIITKKNSTSAGKSFINRILGQIWMSYGIFATVLAAAFAFINPMQIGYIIAVLLGYASTMTGLILKNNFITVGGFITGIGCTLGLFYVQVYDATLFFAVAAVLNLIVPGIMLNRKVNK